MPSSNWLAIVSIMVSAITTLTAPVLALLVAARINQPKPTPEPKKPKNLIHRIGGLLMRVSTSPWILPPFGLLLNICVLPYVIRHANPITGKSVFAISLIVTSAFCNLLLISISGLSRITRKMLDHDETRDETISGIIDVLRIENKILKERE
jgi:hypothetical protein